MATDIGDCEYLVGEGGVVIPAGNVEKMIWAVNQVLGKRMPKKVCSWEQVGMEIIEFVKKG